MTTYACTTAADITGYCNGGGGYTRATYGDVITIPAGTFDCKAAALTPQAGVTIEGVGPAVTIIQGNIQPDLNDYRNPLIISRIKFDATGVNGASTFGSHIFTDGIFRLFDCEFIGGNKGSGDGNCLTFVADGYPCNAMAVRCYAHGAYGDAISAKAPGGATLAAASKLILVDCEGAGPGVAANDQCLTSHDGFPVDDYGGYYHGAAGGGTIVPDATTTIINLTGTRIVHEGSNAAAVNANALKHCLILFSGSAATPVVYCTSAEDCDFTSLDVRPYTSGSFTVSRCRLTTKGVLVHINVTTVLIQDNLVKDVTATNAAGISLNLNFGGMSTVQRNYVTHCYRNFDFRSDANPTIKFANNIAWNPTSACVYTAGAGTISWDSGSGGNQLSGTLTNYTAMTSPPYAANDTTPADATDPQKASIVLTITTSVVGIDSEWARKTGVAAAGSVASGVACYTGGPTGTRVDCPVAKAITTSGNYGDPGSPLAGTYVAPANGDVRYGTANGVSPGAGTCHVPHDYQTLYGVPVDVSGTGTLGSVGDHTGTLQRVVMEE